MQEPEMASRGAEQSETEVAASTRCDMVRAGRTRAARAPAVRTAAPIQSTTITMIASSFASLRLRSQ